MANDHDVIIPWAKLPLSDSLPNICLIACGSYNPPHLQHLRNFEDAKNWLCDKYHVFQGIISPVHDNYRNNKPTLIESRHRIAMCEAATSDSEWLTVSKWEISQNDWVRTAVVLQSHLSVLKTRYNDNINVKLLCGTDILESMLIPNLWKPEHIELIVGTLGLVVLPRPGKDVEEIISKHEVLSRNKNNIILIPSDTNRIATCSVSSTMIRKLVQEFKSPRYLTHDKVIEYIKENKLYHQ